MTNYDDVINDSDFHKWQKYAPLDVQYLKYAESNPSVVAVGHKIGDVYQAFCNARASLIFADSENFGDIAGDSDESRLYAKCHFHSDGRVTDQTIKAEARNMEHIRWL